MVRDIPFTDLAGVHRAVRTSARSAQRARLWTDLERETRRPRPAAGSGSTSRVSSNPATRIGGGLPSTPSTAPQLSWQGSGSIGLLLDVSGVLDGLPSPEPSPCVEPPPQDQWNQTCLSQFGEESDDCDSELTRCGTTTAAEFVAQDPFEFAGSMHTRFNSGDFASETDRDAFDELANAAWSLVNRNLDLLRWAACWVTGHESGECLHDRFEGSGIGSFGVSLWSTTWCERHGVALVVPTVPPYLGNIYLCVQHAVWQTHIAAWRSPVPADRLCSAIEFA